jgi:DnaJ-class molecular chaperone
LYESKEIGPNHYQSLHVNRTASVSEIKKAYRFLSRELHPDRNKSPTASEDFGKIKHSFDVLVNPEFRHIYDRLGNLIFSLYCNTVINNYLLPKRSSSSTQLVISR